MNSENEFQFQQAVEKAEVQPLRERKLSLLLFFLLVLH